MKRLRSFRRLQALMQAKSAVEEARLSKHSLAIAHLKGVSRSAEIERQIQRNQIINGQAIDVSYSAWAEREGHQSRKRQKEIASAMVAHEDQKRLTARAVGAKRVLNELIRNEQATLRQNRGRKVYF